MTGETAGAREARRDDALRRLIDISPYHRFLGVAVRRMGDELTAHLPFDEKLIGNAALPALHGGVTGAFLEIAAIAQLAWEEVWAIMESGDDGAARIARGEFPPFPRTIDVTIDYLRSGRSRDLFARAEIVKRGRRVASLRVEAWQDRRDQPIAAARGHFMLPRT